jgi:hypothetical protein
MTWTKERMKEWRERNKQHILEYARKYRSEHREEFRARARIWRRKNAQQQNEQLRLRRRVNGMSKAHLRIQKLLKNGTLTRKPCEVCGKTPTDAHHDDYSKPLSVRWLCRYHHLSKHRRMP